MLKGGIYELIEVFGTYHIIKLLYMHIISSLV
jgi:hypothetical protein